MTNSNFPGGFANGVTIRNIPVLNSYSAKVFWVDSVHGSNGNKGTFDRPWSTVAYAVTQCTDNNGDIIAVKSGHTETFAAAGDVTLNKIGVAIVGLGQGKDRPIFNFGTAVTASCLITAANVSIQNIVGRAIVNALTQPFDVRAADTYLDIEWHDTSTILEAATCILTTAAAVRLIANLKYRGQTGGSACVAPVKLVGCTGARINLDFNGKASTAVVNFATTLSTDVYITGYIYNSGTTDGSKSVVDTITGSLWFARLEDGAAGEMYSGGSGKTFAKSDTIEVDTVIADLAVPVADVTTNTNERDVIGNKTDAAVTAVGTTKSLAAYAKGHTTMLTVQSADATNNAFAGDVTGNKTDAGVTAVGTTKSLAAYAKGHTTMLTVQSADSANNAFAGDVTGNKTDAAVYVPGTTKSVLAYVKGHSDLQERVAVSATAVLANGTVIFTVAGGPIEIMGLISECVVGGDAQAATVQYAATATGLSLVNISGASGSTANAAAHATVTLIGTALATAAVYAANGTNLGMASPGGIIANVGTITTVIGSGPTTTGTWRHILRYKPLTTGVTVV